MIRSILALLAVLALSSTVVELASAFSPVPARGISNSYNANAIYMSEVEDQAASPPPPPPVKCPNCDKCDGTGRILGGIPLILPWWPIKPYRPCPNFIANGGQYSRIGQPLDEIAFGRGNFDEEDDDF
mmetsp:Transcript_29499/g.45026  ORF Transcript_29499/g.45026 Transcript_29499/m.45026 type:complete len:128 (-) Transcript_29499:2-385(-)|eukprot:CAMPEP_0194114746 /NCGR_PEP_ID=MMETSP0150-20130528/21474_1 /TAXON_ID=122233 /ORGANISM="Chaetoceros debilis, Strain MM31A-1" /LENGTH=127 /DNA_ID=CAMNT_0038805049 /DNA_START=58 /DNA_END=441 /DNA_ORIENTATION=+